MQTQKLWKQNSVFAKAAAKWQLLKLEVPRSTLLERNLKTAQNSVIYQNLLSCMFQHLLQYFIYWLHLSAWGTLSQLHILDCRGHWDYMNYVWLYYNLSRARQGETTKRLFIIYCTSSPRKQKSSICSSCDLPNMRTWFIHLDFCSMYRNLVKGGRGGE